MADIMSAGGKDIERIVAENVAETVWLRLARLTSANLCLQVVRHRAPSLTDEVVSRKAEGVASAVRSALGFWRTPSSALNARVLSRYYALLQISIAEQVASSDEVVDLEAVQRQTETGHGLATLPEGDAFPHAYRVGCLSGGHFYHYCRHRGIEIAAHVLRKRPRDWATLPDDERDKMVSLADLLRRVPELQPIVRETLDLPPLSFHIGYAERNNVRAADRMARMSRASGRLKMFETPPPEGPTVTTFVAVYPNDPAVTADFLKTLGLPFQNIQVEQDAESGRYPHLVGELPLAPA